MQHPFLCQNSLSTSLSGRYGTFTASASFGMKNLNQNINQNTKLGESVTEFTIGSRDIPLPIHLELIPITKALDKIWWGNLTEWKRDKIDTKQRNLAKALKDYPKNVHAKINKGMFLIILYYCYYSETSDSGPSEIGTLYNRPLYKGHCLRSQKLLPLQL